MWICQFAYIPVWLTVRVKKGRPSFQRLTSQCPFHFPLCAEVRGTDKPSSFQKIFFLLDCSTDMVLFEYFVSQCPLGPVNNSPVTPVKMMLSLSITGCPGILFQGWSEYLRLEQAITLRV